ncbi:MAG: gamma-aminobutyrate dehydratase [Chloroflexi bacterium]|nr:gamma-aminobutyrate dehydratase [Chloroflexota bacterium]
MPLRTPQQYVDSLKDGRSVYFRGQPVPDVTTHPVIGQAVKHACIDYEMAEDAQHRDLATATAPDSAKPFSRYYKLPQNTDDLLKRSALIEEATRIGATVVILIKEIGTDALFGLHLIANQMDEQLGTKYLGRVRDFYRYCRDNDLALAVAQSDPKGDRRRGPSEQVHPDYYLHVVDRNDKGIVVRGAKVHTSVSTNSNEIIVLPTRAMGPNDGDYAVAFATPANAPGLKMIASSYGSREHNDFEQPISSKHKMMETLTIYDDVFVPWERVFMCGETQFAGPLALAFVEFHRFTAISYKLPLVDVFVGATQLMAEYNGIEKVPHVREKIFKLANYAETLRALTRHAAMECHHDPVGLAVPNTLVVNMAKFHFATSYHQMLNYVQDITGGLIVTNVSKEDLEHPELGKYVDHYLGGKAGIRTEDRLRAINLVAELTANDLGGYHAVLAVHAEGSIEAEKLAIVRATNVAKSVAYAKELAGINDR